MSSRDELEMNVSVRTDDKFRAENVVMKANDELVRAQYALERAEDELAFAKWTEKYLRGLYEASKSEGST